MASLLEETLKKIKPIDNELANLAQRKLDSLTKPQGSLGLLEDCAKKYVAARNDLQAEIQNPTILTFAADHGVAEEGVSAFPQEVTPQMIVNFANGGAAINVLARHAGANLKVIDMGVATQYDVPDSTKCQVIDRKIANGTANIAQGPAMSLDQAKQAIEIGIEIAENEIKSGSTLLGTGDMGIANTTPSAAIYSALLHLDPADIAGRGTGIDDTKLNHKIEVIEKALVVNRHSLTGSPLEIMAAVGGFEIAGICGAILGAAANNVPIVIDGFISGAAAVAAMFMQAEGKSPMPIQDYCFFSHLSAEAGHINVMQAIGSRPILDLGLRLGEGTGAALAFNIIESGLKIMNEMATFDSAGVAEKG